MLLKKPTYFNDILGRVEKNLVIFLWVLKYVYYNILYYLQITCDIFPFVFNEKYQH